MPALLAIALAAGLVGVLPPAARARTSGEARSAEPDGRTEIAGLRWQPSAEVRARGEVRVDPYTGGGRALHYELEGVLPWGDDAGETHRAYGLASELGLRTGACDVTGGVAHASGTSKDGRVDELDNFFPTNHGSYVNADVFGWCNVLDGYGEVRLALDAPLITASGVFHVLALPEPGARWSNAGGATLGLGPDNEDRLAGYELDVHVTARPASHLSVSGGYALFVPAATAERLGHPDPTHWAYVMAGAVFR